MDAIDFLTGQHRALEALLAGVLESAEPAARRRRCAEAADGISLHLCAEEQLFHPAMKSLHVDGIDAMPAAASGEHAALKGQVCELLRLSPRDAAFEAAVLALTQRLRRHCREEEEQLFPSVGRLMDAATREALGCEMIALQTRMKLEGRPRDAMAAAPA
jgi:hypothetical protein